MHVFLEMINHPAEAFKRPSTKLSHGLVLSAVLCAVLLDPLLGHYANGFDVSVFNVKTPLLLAAGWVSYVLCCSGLHFICKAFGSASSFKQHFYTWGMTYFPTLCCAFVLAFTENYFYLFWDNALLGMMFCFVFVSILIWKTILYAVYLRKAANLQGRSFGRAFFVCGIWIFILAVGNVTIGLKTPIL